MVKFYKLKNKMTAENFINLFIILCPILDIASYVFRYYFTDNPDTSRSITTILRPIIPVILAIYVFAKSNIKEKAKLLFVAAIYCVYIVLHLVISKPNFTGWAAGTIKDELSYLINYTFMITNLIVFHKIFTNKSYKRVQYSIVIALAIYVVTIYIAILTNSSSYTYPETQMGYKGWIESGNSLSIMMLIGLSVLLMNIKPIPFKSFFSKKNIPMYLLYILLGLTVFYLACLMGTRTGLYGSIIIIGVWSALRIIKDKDWKSLVIGIVLLGIIFTLIKTIGSYTTQRQNHLEEQSKKIVEETLDGQAPQTKNEPTETTIVEKQEVETKPEIKEPSKKAHVTRDILIYKEKIDLDEMQDDFMNEEQKNALLKLYDEAEKRNVEANDNRAQQMLYNMILIKEQTDLKMIFFGNGYLSNHGELVLEKEAFALLFNFGVFGFILYLGPIIFVIVEAGVLIINRKIKLNSNGWLTIFIALMVLGFSTMIGYVLFNITNSTMIVALCAMLIKRLEEKE